LAGPRSADAKPSLAAAEARQRLDKWLWFARVVKTRTQAAKLVAEGHVRVNGARIEDPAKTLKCGDVVTIALERQVRVLKVLEPGSRRGPFEEARRLFDDIGPTGVVPRPIQNDEPEGRF
jgi:ribosome-associated heat shock protein Hsp15